MNLTLPKDTNQLLIVPNSDHPLFDNRLDLMIKEMVRLIDQVVMDILYV